ncbi:MAG: YceI family protein [Phycisphaerae bacterium]
MSRISWSWIAAIAATVGAVSRPVAARDAVGDALRAAPRDLLVVFVAPQASDLARSFAKDHLEKIRAVATSLHIPVRVIDIGGGAPEEITITPLLVFQNHRGRSIFQGRYATLDRLRNFLRTSRVVPQGDKPLVKRGVAVWRSGRAIVTAPIKIAPVSGDPPEGYDRTAFAKEATRALSAGFKRFQPVDTISLRRADRLFYMDFNPWVSADGTLFLSVALYSQFHCKKPIFTHGGKPFVGPWADRTRLFAQAAAAMGQAVGDAITESLVGDGLDPVPSETPVVSWESMGLALPPRPASAPTTSDGPPLGRRWVVEARKPEARMETEAAPQVVFRFPAPLDGYSGEVGRVTGSFDLPSDLALAQGRGSFVAEMMTVTMGDPDLDHALHDSSFFLNAAKYPTSRFVIESIAVDPAAGVSRLTYGELTAMTMSGAFTLKGVSIPLSVRSMVEPIVASDGTPRIVMRGAFEIRLSPFGIDGPDPPEDGSVAHDTLLFDFNLMLKPR